MPQRLPLAVVDPRDRIGAGHISGVYQWVNKVYQAQMFNYGVRMMYDFMVAEPAAFLIYAMRSAHANATELEKPTPFTWSPESRCVPPITARNTMWFTMLELMWTPPLSPVPVNRIE